MAEIDVDKISGWSRDPDLNTEFEGMSVKERSDPANPANEHMRKVMAYMKALYEMGGSGGGGGTSNIAWLPEIDGDGNLSWTRSSSTTAPNPFNVVGPKGEQGQKGDKGDKGDTGEQGPKGDAGDPASYDDTALASRVTAVETALDGHTVGVDVPADAVFTDTVYDDTDIAARVTSSETAIADRYTKAETDAAIAASAADPEREHFHVVTVLPTVANAKDNHEYVVVEYGQDGTTIESETHYLFYGGAFHQRNTSVSLDGYATEQYVSDSISTKQDTLVSGTNIKTINGSSLLGEGNLTISEVPTGGSTGQILSKASDTNGDLEWIEHPSWFAPDFTVSDWSLSFGQAYATGSTYTAAIVVAKDGSGAALDGDGLHGVDLASKKFVTDSLNTKQDTLESGVNIKTVGGENLLGSGNVSIKTINNEAIVGSGNVSVTKTLYDTEYKTATLYDAGSKVEIAMRKVDDNTLNINEYAPDSRGQSQEVFNMNIPTKGYVDGALANKQDTLVSGTNIKTVNGNSLLGEGNLVIEGGSSNTNFDIGTVPLGGAGVYEVNAILSNNDSERVRATYSRGVNGELPDWFSMSVTSGLGTDDFHVATKEYADKEVAKKGNAKITFDNEYQYLQIRDDNGTDIGFSQETANTVRIQEYAKDDRGQVQKIFDEVLVSEAALENAVTESGFFVVDTATTYTYAQLKAIVQTGRAVVTHEGQTNVVISHDCVDDNLEGQNYIVLTVIKKIYSGGVPPVVLHYSWWGEIGGEFSFTSTSQSRVENVSNSFSGGSPSDLLTKSAISSKFNEKQDTLVSGTNIKTVNGNSVLGEGNLEIAGGVNFEVGVEKPYGTYTADGVTYQVYSKLLDIGPLPSTAGVTQYPHGITGIKQILQINGFTNDGFVMNAPRQTAADNISIYQAQKAGNIAIEVGKDRSSKNGFVMMIYAKNN